MRWCWSPPGEELNCGHGPPVAEAVQEAWLGVIGGLDRFEGRSLLKTWILSLLVNQAKTRGIREARSAYVSVIARKPAG